MDTKLTGNELDKLGIHICNREFGTGNSIINEVKCHDRKLIDLNSLKPDSGWDDYNNKFTTYSKSCLESAEVIDCEPIVYADWVLRPWADCTCSNCGYNCGVSELKTPRCAWCGAYMRNWKDDEDEHGVVHVYEEL